MVATGFSAVARGDGGEGGAVAAAAAANGGGNIWALCGCDDTALLKSVARWVRYDQC